MSARNSSTQAAVSLLVVVGHAAVAALVLVVPVWALATSLRTVAAGSEGVSGMLDRWPGLLASTAQVCAVALVVATGGGTVLGFLLSRTDLPGRRLLVFLVVLGACVPIYISAIFAFAWVPAARLAGSTVACGVLYGLFYIPLATIVLGVTFRGVDRELGEAALLDARAAKVLRLVTVPQSVWGFAGLAFLLILLVATDFTIPDLLCVRTFAEETHTQYVLHRRTAGPILTGMPLAIVLGVAMLWVQRRLGVWGRLTPAARGVPARRMALGRAGGIVLVGLAGVLLPALALPAATLLGKIGSPGRFFERAFALQPVLLRSVLVAGLAATVTVAVSVGLAWTLLRGGRLRVIVGALVVLTLALPAPVAGISLIELCDRPGWLGRVYDSPALIVYAYLVRFLAVGVLLVAAGVQRVPRELEDAARVDGAAWATVQRAVYWPAAGGHAWAAWLIVMVLCFADVGATKFVVPPGWDTAAVTAFAAMHARVDSNLAVLALLSAGYVALMWLGLVGLIRRARREAA